jgi:maltose alpha-D-glucosyltransferase/alpha-amylase
MPWAQLWERSVAGAFLRAYREAAAGAAYLPADPADFRQLLRAYLVNKVLSELIYELKNRPAWVRIPLEGILSLPV